MGGKSGRLFNPVVFIEDALMMRGSSFVRIVSLFVNAIVRIAVTIEIVKSKNFIEIVDENVL